MLRSEKFHSYLSGYILRAKNRIVNPNEVASTETGRFMILKAVWLRIQVCGKVNVCTWLSGLRRIEGSWCPYHQVDSSTRRHHDPSKDTEKLTQKTGRHIPEDLKTQL